MTTQSQSRQRRALEANLLGLGAAMALAAPAFLAAPSPAAAAPITFTLSPFVVGAVTGGDDTVMGTFVLDPTGSVFGPTLDSVDLTVTGPLNAGVYDEPVGGNGAVQAPGEIDVRTTSTSGPTLAFELFFASPLPVYPFDNVTAFNFTLPSSVDTGLREGAAVPVATTVPEPATWAMMLLGFAGLGFAARRRAKSRGRVGFSAA
jgi:PEP-CTERM motif